MSKGGKFQITVPKQTHDYLAYLASIGKGGSSIPDVAAFVLIETLNQRLSWISSFAPLPLSITLLTSTKCSSIAATRPPLGR